MNDEFVKIKFKKCKPLFFGNGDKSSAQAYEVYKAIQESFSVMNGLQQGYYTEEEGRTGSFHLYQNLRKVLMLMCGLELPMIPDQTKGGTNFYDNIKY